MQAATQPTLSLKPGVKARPPLHKRKRTAAVKAASRSAPVAKAPSKPTPTPVVVARLDPKSPAQRAREAAEQQAACAAFVVARDWLCAQLPHDEAGQPLPLALGVFSALYAAAPPGISRTCLRHALSRYTGRSVYLSALARDGSERHDPVGGVVGPVSDEHRAGARVVLKRRGA